MSRLRTSAFASFLVGTLSIGDAQAWEDRTLYIRSVYPVDASGRYCVELRGDAIDILLAEPVQARSCGEDMDGEKAVDGERIQYNRIGFKKNTFCLETREGTAPGARIFAAICTDNWLLRSAFPPDSPDSPAGPLKDPLQRWKFTMGFGIVPKTNLWACITLGEGPGTPTGRWRADGLPELSRPLTLEPCDSSTVRRQRWRLVEG